MLVNKSGMRAGDTANIVGESGGSKTQWKLDNKRSVQKDQEGAVWIMHRGRAEDHQNTTIEPTTADDQGSPTANPVLAAGAGLQGAG